MQLVGVDCNPRGNSHTQKKTIGSRHMIDILVPYYNHICGVRQIEQDIGSMKDQMFLTISNDSQDAALDLKENWLSGPKKGAVRNWNFLLGKVRNNQFVLLHQDERILARREHRKVNLENDFVYVCDLKLIFVGKEIFLSGKLRVWLMTRFPRLIFYVNFIGPTATLIIPKNDLQFDESLQWLVDVEYYSRLRKNYMFKYTPKFYVISDTTASNSITNSGNIGNIDEREVSELRQLSKDKKSLFKYFLKFLWHFYRIINTRKL